MSIASNIRELRTSRDWTQEQLAEKIGVTRSTVTQWETGWSQPRMGAIEKLAAAFEITAADIVAEKSQRIAPRGASPVEGMDGGYVPLRGRVHAGPFSYPENLEAREELVLVPQFLIDDDPDVYACEVEGDCMNKVYPEKNCVIVVSPNKEPLNGSIAVVSIDGCDAVVRRMYRTRNTLVLSPESYNDEHKDIVITDDDEHTVELCGKVVWYQASSELA
ncbi:LexA family protein [Raoultibacter phocaeensis]|uniref:LexA family protein n=1 Tax=Raoultibacter phocaeensis TaxID=2479841 RepID=UPI00111B621A|nr:S24 family peptidase [Raoultibacter phocaeensis]